MKVKHLAAVCAVLCGGSVYAATTAVSCDPTSVGGLVNTCAPDVTFLIGGASAQQGALEGVLKSGAILDTSKVGARLTVAGSSNALANGNNIAYYGIGAAGTSYANKRVLVMYNKANGSAGGVSTLLTKKGTTLSIAGGAAVDQNEQSAWLQLPSPATLKAGTAGTCTVGSNLTDVTAWGNVTCSTVGAIGAGIGIDKQKALHMALSDVRPSELSPGIIKKWDTVKFPAQVTGMEGFGVIVNAPLYAALIKSNIADGLLPASCDNSGEAIGTTTDTITAACQPSLKRADYAAIITGKITSGDSWFGSDIGQGKALRLFRRVDSSGTQASSNIFFAGQAAYNSKSPGTDGFATLLNQSSTAPLVFEGVSTGDVISGVSGAAAVTNAVGTVAANTTDFALGVVSLENYYSMTKSDSKLKGAAFVRLDGISPNFDASGNLDSKNRVGLMAGYPFSMEMVAIKPSTLTGAYSDIATAITTGLTNPANNLPGIAYIGSSDSAKNTNYTHGGNNYLPLAKQQ